MGSKLTIPNGQNEIPVYSLAIEIAIEINCYTLAPCFLSVTVDGPKLTDPIDHFHV